MNEHFQEQRSHQSSDSQLNQIQAFPLPDEPENEEDQEAYAYLLKVRKQAEKVRQSWDEMKDQNKEEQKRLKKNDTIKNEENHPESWMQEWKKQVMRDWLCVVNNIKYLHTIQPSTSKLSSPVKFDQTPKIHELISLPLGRIETLIQKLCYQTMKQLMKQKSDKIKNLYLWQYSLLALHQALSPYKIFALLADINSTLNSQLVECKILKIIMREHFCQYHLKAY